MAGFPKFKFSIFTVTIVFALLAASSSELIGLEEDFEEEWRGEDDVSLFKLILITKVISFIS